jgi:hypothetical protein
VFCRQSVTIVPDSGIYRFRLGRLLESRGHLDEARRQLDRAAELGFNPEQAGFKAAVEAEQSQTSNSGPLLKGSAA